MAEVYSAYGTAALVSGTPKTIVEIGSSATATGRWCSVTATNPSTTVGQVVEFCRYAATGTGTTYTPLKYNGEGQARAALLTAKVADTVEPTTAVVIESHYVPPMSEGTWQWPLGREFYQYGALIAGVRITAAGTHSPTVTVVWEE